jgi:glycosyltransferase involved in cell wall biosynthesis
LFVKLAFVVQRYGKDILGGSETLARQLAERLARRHEITVLTTTAKDYITWRNEYEPGEETFRGVRVRRFPVVGERDLEEFNAFSQTIYGGSASKEAEIEWLERQGPVVPELIEYLEKEHERFDLIVFFTYLYYPTYFGLTVAPEKSVLVPTAHDEPPLRLGIFKEMFQLPSAFLFNTEGEEILVLERFPVHKKMRETIGMGMELLDQPDPSSFRKKHNIPGKYFLYAGRIDEGKRVDELCRYFSFFKEEYPQSGNLQLVLIGQLGMKLPEDSSIRYVGFVDEAEKLSAMAGATAVVQPSRMESLSIVTLEAFSVGTPVLASAASAVLVDHCKKANAGFYYRDFEDFEELVGILLTERNLGRTMGRNGQRYIKENYGWAKLLPKYELAFRASARPSRPRRGRESAEQMRAERPTREPAVAERQVETAPALEEVVLEAAAEKQTPVSGSGLEEGSRPGESAVLQEQEPAEGEATGSESEAESESDSGPEEEREVSPEPAEAPPDVAVHERAEAEVSDVSRESSPEREQDQVPEREAFSEAEESEKPEPEPEPELEPEPEPEPETEPEAAPPSPEVAHLPSFYQSSVPPRPAPPRASAPEGVGVVERAPKTVATREPESESESERDAEPEPGPALAPGELPEFFQPKSKRRDERKTEPSSLSEASPDEEQARVTQSQASTNAVEGGDDEAGEDEREKEPENESEEERH